MRRSKPSAALASNLLASALNIPRSTRGKAKNRSSQPSCATLVSCTRSRGGMLR
jgi:hypothetical protein